MVKSQTNTKVIYVHLVLHGPATRLLSNSQWEPFNVHECIIVWK